VINSFAQVTEYIGTNARVQMYKNPIVKLGGACSIHGLWVSQDEIMRMPMHELTKLARSVAQTRSFVTQNGLMIRLGLKGGMQATNSLKENNRLNGMSNVVEKRPKVK